MARAKEQAEKAPRKRKTKAAAPAKKAKEKTTPVEKPKVPTEETKARAVAKYVRVSPRKAQQVIDLVRGKGVEEALALLQFSPKTAAKIISKVVNSAAANAEKNHRLKRESLYIVEAYVNQGPTLKRFRHRAMGRASRIHKRTSHITVALGKQETGEVKRGAKG